MSKGEATRLAVLDLAMKRAAVIGLEGLSIGRLANEMAMSKSGLFAHFRSKSALQTQVLQHAADVFVDAVVRPALRAPRGEPRVRALFDHWLAWFESRGSTGCLFIAATTELDDRPCEARDFLVAQQKDWLAFIASVARTAVEEGDFREDLDVEQFAFEMYGIAFMLHLTVRLLEDASALKRGTSAFDSLLQRSRTF